MHPTPPARVTERLRRLRARFPEGARDRHVDHDHDRLTSTQRRFVPERTFFLGEIWWAVRGALGDTRPHRVGSGHLPGLVTRQESRAHAPVELAPPAWRAPGAAGTADFRPATAPEGLDAGTVFLLPYRRPVPREELGGRLGRLASREVQSLAGALELLRRGGEGRG